MHLHQGQPHPKQEEEVGLEEEEYEEDGAAGHGAAEVKGGRHPAGQGHCPALVQTVESPKGMS